MKLRNNFSTEDRELWIWWYTCFYCGKNQWNCLHHILGRSSSSILNSAPLHNIGCHIGNGKLATFEVQKKLLKKTYEYLMSNGYSLTEDDTMFIQKNKKYYNDICKRE